MILQKAEKGVITLSVDDLKNNFSKLNFNIGKNNSVVFDNAIANSISLGLDVDLSQIKNSKHTVGNMTDVSKEFQVKTELRNQRTLEI